MAFVVRVCGSFADNDNLGTKVVQEIVDALPHARMQRLMIWGAFSSPSSVVVLGRPHAAHPLLLGGVCWCGCTHMQLGACGGGGIFGLLARTMLLCLLSCDVASLCGCYMARACACVMGAASLFQAPASPARWCFGTRGPA